MKHFQIVLLRGSKDNRARVAELCYFSFPWPQLLAPT